MNMDAIFAKKVAERAASGLVANNGIACSSVAQRDYYNFRDEMRARPDWGHLPSDLEQKLSSMKAEAWAKK